MTLEIPALELCTDDPVAIEFAENLGYKRVELCCGIEIGGLTPSPGLIQKSSLFNTIETHVLLRHRGGNFFYDEKEYDIIMADIKNAYECGADGIVTGCLNRDFTIDLELSEQIVTVAHSLGLECTFHRAFDFVHDPRSSLEQLIELGFSRVLTSGGKPRAAEGIKNIEEYVSFASGRIEIMAGSGINDSNAKSISESGVDALHFTAYRSAKTEQLGMGTSKVPDFAKIESIAKKFPSR